jgi:2-polyprenyl-3-methyl-5-hydroxy-6-metoxy-1,4-benzoquinol methylase
LFPRRSAGRKAGSKEIISRFRSDSYLAINPRRLEHLAALQIPLFNRSVLEVGSGIGDLSRFFTDRDCKVTLTDGRLENVEVLRGLYPDLEAFRLDLDKPETVLAGRFDVVFCYGTLYHLARPAEAIAYMAERCDGILLLETCVSFGGEPLLCHVTEESEADQALAGIGSRPTRTWIQQQLSQHFEFAYLPTVQPAHSQFPTDWIGKPTTSLTRAVFVASRRPLDNPLLTTSVPDRQGRV